MLPADFWEHPKIRSALLSRHFGLFVRVYRMIQSPRVKQADVARWLGITQGQLSKIERSSMPVRDLDKLVRWARARYPTANAVQAQEYDRANALATDAIELTNRTETTLAKRRLLVVAATLPSTNKTDASGILQDQIMSTLRR
ncbi:MAG: hypothetical protein ACRDRP_06535 [Pseudonocardiaceae bacterium]